MNNTIPKKETIFQIPISELCEFPDHPFKVTKDDSMHELKESIEKYGILTNIIARPLESGGYQILSGHRRVYVAKELGIEKVPVEIRNVDINEATIIMVDCNLQREFILPSEKAKAYKMKMDAIRHQGSKLNPQTGECQNLAVPSESSSRSDELIANSAEDSARNIQRYIRLNYLNPEILNLVDENKMGITPAVEISYLKSDEQEFLIDAIRSEVSIPSLSQAQRMKNMSQEGTLNKAEIDSIMKESKKDTRSIVLPSNFINKYFPQSFTPKQIIDTIEKSLVYILRKQKEIKQSKEER